MSQIIDRKVVEMRFDNKQFEAGTKQTMSSLTKLKEALKLPNLDKALDGIDKSVKNISLDGIAAGVESLQQRFSTMGIVGMRVIENITDGLMGKMNRAINFVSDSIISGGIKRAMNIENAHFQLQALLKDETKVQAIMADAMEAVDGTAYAYDEAAKAASQFAASGVQSGEDMLGALKGITGVAAMTNSSFEDISNVFTTVAGNGRLMGDQLLQLSSRGLNAASTLSDYFKQVRGQSDMTESTIREMVSKGKISFKDFSDAMTWAFGDSAKRANETFTGAFSNMKSALARIGAGFISPLVEQNGKLVQLFNALRIKINDVKSELVFDEERSAIAGLADVTGLANEELSGMFKTIKSNGKVTISDLDTLTEKGADATSALTKYVNGVTKGSIRASYAITSALSELTNGTEVSTEDIRRFVEEGKIDLSTFTSAMETEFGTEKTLTKQFTDWFLDQTSTLVDTINNFDVSKPMDIFYHSVESVKNVTKGLMSVIRPIGKAFSDAFNFKIDDVVELSNAIEQLTSKMRLSKKDSKNLHDAMEGLFNIGKLLLDILIWLLKAILPIHEPVVEVGSGFLSLAGAIGRTITFITNLLRSLTLLNKSLWLIPKGISIVMDGVSGLIKITNNFFESVSKLEGTKKLLDSFGNVFKKLSKEATPYVESFIKEVEKLFDSLIDIDEIDLDDVLKAISKAFEDLAWEIDHFSLKTVENAFDSLKAKLKSFQDLIMSNKGFATFIKNAKTFGEELSEAFTWDNLLSRIQKAMDVFDKFFKWIRDTFSPAFEDITVKDVAAAGSGFGILYTMIKMSKSFEKLVGSIKSIPDLLGGIKGTLESYQKDLKASALLKIAGAIGILAASLVLLSFADTGRLMDAALALTLIAGVLMLAVTKLLEAINKGKEMNAALTIFSKGLSSTMKKFGKSLEIRAIGKSVKDFAESIAIIAVSIISLGIMYKKDKESFIIGTKFVAAIGAALVGVIALGSIIGKFAGSGMTEFSSLLKSITSLTIGLAISVAALNKLFKMDLPNDWEIKVEILGGLLVGMAVLALVLGIAGNISGGGSSKILAGINNPIIKKIFKSTAVSNGGSVSSGPILAMAAMLYTTVLALNKLFKMKLPSDYQEKITILALMFASFGALMIAMGAASKLAGGSIKAGGTISAMSAFVAVIVASLMVLTIIPTDKMIKGATALGIVLTTLGVALYGAGKITTAETSKSILAMAITVAAITASLTVLGIISFPSLLKGAVSLGSILLILAEDFKQISKVVNEKSWLTIMAMIAAILSITYSLSILSEQPWESLLAGASGLGAVLLSISGSMAIISKSDASLKNMTFFLECVLSLIIITESLYKLSEQPWESLLAGASGLGAVLLSISGSMAIISMAKPNLVGMAAFLEGVLGVMAIAYALYELAEQPWESLKAASEALSTVLLSMSASMAILTLVGAAAPAAIAGGGLLITFILVIYEVVKKLGKVSEESKKLLEGGGEVLAAIGKAIGGFIGSIIAGGLESMANSLPAIGSSLTLFMENVSGFIEGSKSVDENALKGVGILAACIIAITAAEVISGIGFFLGGAVGLVAMAANLNAFITTIKPFLDSVKDIDENSMTAVKNLAEMIIILTAADMLNGISRIFGLGGNFSDFAEELKDFGPAIKDFAADVEGINEESVKGAAAAASIMAETASKLQGHGGIIQDIIGDKSLATFAKELKAFGPAIKDFADVVKDVDPSSVEGAAAAASIMAETADKLPAQEGFAQKIFGKKSLSEFGKELTSFGKSIVPFCDAVKDINSESVKGAATAASIMAETADKLPVQDGLIKKIFGKKSLSEFGKELTSFGKSIVPFCDNVKGIDASSANGAATVAKIMSDLSNDLPNSSNLWDKIFGGGQVTLSQFGEELVKFGNSMSDFSNSVSNVKESNVNGAINSFKKLVDLTTYVKAASTDDLVKFSKELSKIGSDSVTNFIKTFTNSENKVKNAVNSLMRVAISTFNSQGDKLKREAVKVGDDVCDGLINAIILKQPSVISAETNLTTSMIQTLRDSLPDSKFNLTSRNAMDGLIKGVNDKKPSTISTVGNLCTDIGNRFREGLPVSRFSELGQNTAQGLIKGIDDKRYSAASSVANMCGTISNNFTNGLSVKKFTETGKNAVEATISGIDSKKQDAKYSASQLSNSIVYEFNENLSESKFRLIGKNVSLGLKYGIESKASDVIKASTSIAKNAIASVNGELKIASPSKVLFKIGEFFSMGLANGIIDKLKAVRLASEKAADETLEPVKDTVNTVVSIINSEDFNIDPVIRPVLDLSNVQKGVKEIGSMMDRTYNLSAMYNKALDVSSTFTRNNSSSNDISSTPYKKESGNTYNFVQNNNSPKALTRSEIYRQTNNQFSSFIRAVNPS